MDNGRRGIRRLLTIAGVALAIAVIWAAISTVWLWRYQERVVFQPPSAPVEAPAPAQRVEFRASDGHALFGYLVAPKTESREPRIVVIAFHGNADLAAWTVPWARELVERAGVTVLIPEYRGYGGIPGSPTYATGAADARGALAFVDSQLRPSRVVLFGHSLGTAIASELAVAMRPAVPSALVLQSPFTSAQDMAARMLVPPIGRLWRRISRVHYDTRARVAELACPVWVAHGTRDLNIPVRMGRQVFAAARYPGSMLEVEGAGHNDVANVGGEQYWRWLKAAVTAASDTRSPVAERR